MRHSRAKQFERARSDSAAAPSGRPWHTFAEDPNDPAAVARRAAVLRQAWRPTIADRIEYLEQRCTNRKVLDIGCVAHSTSRVAAPSWLHARLAAVASKCIGVDVLEDEVAELARLGHRIIAHDLTNGLGPVADEAPFDVIVAGELIEHVEAVNMLFEVAKEALGPDGVLIITTPNPYAPHRVRAGQRGIIWENVDHILYAFPSGIAELAQRHELLLAEATTVEDPRASLQLYAMARAVWRRVRGGQWTTHGFTTLDEPRATRVEPMWISRVVARVMRSRRPFIDETFVYVLRQQDGPAT